MIGQILLCDVVLVHHHWLYILGCCAKQALLDVSCVALRWDKGHIDEWSAMTYPDEVVPYIVSEFKRMKERQADLLGFNTRYRPKL